MRDKSKPSLCASSSSKQQVLNRAPDSSVWDCWIGHRHHHPLEETHTKRSTRALCPTNLTAMFWSRVFKKNSKALSKRKADCSILSAREVRAFFFSRIDADHVIKRRKGHPRHESISASEASFAGSCRTHQPQGHNMLIQSLYWEKRDPAVSDKHLLTGHKKKSTTVSTSSLFYQKILSPRLSLTLHFSGSIKGVMKLITETAAS